MLDGKAQEQNKQNNKKYKKKEIHGGASLPIGSCSLPSGAPNYFVMAIIPEGCILVARKIRESKIWQKPAWWYKVFSYLIMEVNYIPNGYLKRGEGFFRYRDIYKDCNLAQEGIKIKAIDNVIRWMRKEAICTTQKTTRGIYIYLCNYTTYQNIHNYRNDTENDKETTKKRQRNDTISKERKERKERNNIYMDFEKSIYIAWNSLCDKYPILSKIRSISPERRKSLKRRFAVKDFTENWTKVLQEIPKYPFLLGENDRKWVVSFDWLIKNDTNYLKVLEGKYKQNKKTGIDKYIRKD